MWVIQNLNDGTFWSNELGWVGIESAVVYSDEEREGVVHLPLESKWVILWELSALRFARLVTECDAVGLFADKSLMDLVAIGMNMDVSEVYELVDRAKVCWDSYGVGS